MSICLDLDGIEFKFQIDEYKQDSNDIREAEWCKCDLQLTSESGLNLNRSGGLLQCCEVDEIQHEMNELLRNDETGEPRELEFTEPDFRMVVHPRKDLRKEYEYCVEGYEFQDIFIEWKMYFWNYGLTDNYIAVVLRRDDIQKMVEYISNIVDG